MQYFTRQEQRSKSEQISQPFRLISQPLVGAMPLRLGTAGLDRVAQPLACLQPG